MWFRAAAVVATVVCGFCGGSGEARADEARPDADGDARVSFEWNAADGCPDGAAARAAVARFAGNAAFDPSYSVTVRVDLVPGPDGDWRAQVELRSSHGQGGREFHGPTCEDVAQAATLIVAVMLDPLETAMRVKAAEARAAAARREGQPDDVGEASRSRSRWQVGLETSGDIGSLPAPTLGIGVEAGLHAGMARLEAEGAYWVRARATGGPTPGSGGQIGLFAGGLRGCLDAVRSATDAFRLGVCLHGELGVSTGSGFGIDLPARSSALWGAGFAGLSAQLNSSPLATWLTVEAGTPLVRPVYAIDGFGEVFRASPALLRVSSGVAWSFP
jgi:hypothetical protein